MKALPKRARKDISRLMRGRVKSSNYYRRRYSTDASLFKLRPELIAQPKNSQDVQSLVKYVRQHHRTYPGLSLTARSGGTDMGGGPLTESIVVDFSKYFKGIGPVGTAQITAEPGVYYRDFEKVTLSKNLIMPAYPASREICMLGGMIANNAGGEKSLRFGKTDRYVKSLKVVLADGGLYDLKSLNRSELKLKMRQTNFEGQVYRQLYRLLEDNYDFIRSTRPRVSKDSTGYHLFDIWNKRTFDLTKLFVGSQGTLGLVTAATFKLVPKAPHSALLVGFLPDLAHLGEIINTVNAAKPSSFESFDDHTLKFALRFFPYFRRRFGWWGLIKLGLQLLPEARLLVKGFPKLIIMIEFEGTDEQANRDKIERLIKKLRPYGIALETAIKPRQARKYWLLRRESFNILRNNVKDKHTAPFIDDIIVPPHHLPDFLPRLRQILDKYQLLYTIAGHLGDGNFHIIPLMSLKLASERAKIEPLMKEVTRLVVEFGGSISGEHNDGLVRGPFLEQMHGTKLMGLFEAVKHIFDPYNIFNPHKKTDATWEYSSRYIKKRF